MKLRLTVALAALLTLGLTACNRRPPAMAPQPSPPPIAEAAPEEMVLVEVLFPELPPVVAEPEPAPAPPPRPRPARPAAANPVAPEPEPAAEPAPQPTLSAGLPDAETEQHRRRTEQLLLLAEANLRSITRVLSRDEENVAQQVRDFVQQARQAGAAADLVRARTLAVKAHLLSNELVKR